MLLDYIDGTLSEREQTRVADHVASCPGCSLIVEETQQALSAVRRLPEMPLPAGFMARLHERLDREDEKQVSHSWFLLNRSFALRGAALAMVACLAVVILVKTIDMPQTGNISAEKAAIQTVREPAAPAADTVMHARDAEVATVGGTRQPGGKLKEADRPAHVVSTPQQALTGSRKKEAQEKRLGEAAPAEMKAHEGAQLSRPASRAPAGVLKQKSAAAQPLEWIGRTTGLGAPEPRIIKDNASWAGLWKKHALGLAPEIDFLQYMVVAVFQSGQSNGGSVAISDIKYEPTRIVVEYSEKAQAEGQSAVSGLSSYHMKAIKRSELPVEFLKTSPR